MGFDKTGDGFGSTGAGTAADVIYKGASPTTITVGGEPVGTPIYGKSVQQILQEVLVPYILPAFASFYNNVYGLFGNPLEVGTTISGNATFNYSFSTVADVTDNTISILNNSSTPIATGLSIANGLGVSVGINTVTMNTPSGYSWTATALDTASATITSGAYTVIWLWREWYGNNTLTTLTAAQIQNATYLESSFLSSSPTGSYNFAAGGYKWFVWDDSLGSPTAVTGFKDSATGLQISMADNTDDPVFFSNVQNGWYYGLVSVTQNGVTSNKRCYRTKNQLGGSITAIIS